MKPAPNSLLYRAVYHLQLMRTQVLVNLVAFCTQLKLLLLLHLALLNRLVLLLHLSAVVVVGYFWFAAWLCFKQRGKRNSTN